MSYDPKEEWVLYQMEELEGHKVMKFRFRSIDSRRVNGYEMRKCKDVYTRTEVEAWGRLDKVEWED